MRRRLSSASLIALMSLLSAVQMSRSKYAVCRSVPRRSSDGHIRSAMVESPGSMNHSVTTKVLPSAGSWGEDWLIFIKVLEFCLSAGKRNRLLPCTCRPALLCDRFWMELPIFQGLNLTEQCIGAGLKHPLDAFDGGVPPGQAPLRLRSSPLPYPASQCHL